MLVGGGGIDVLPALNLGFSQIPTPSRPKKGGDANILLSEGSMMESDATAKEHTQLRALLAAFA